MSKHYIYEIFGIKIGATNDIERRMKQQGVNEGEYRIIEEHTNAKICSIREIELQKEFNYPIDKVQYWKTLKMQKRGISETANKKRKKTLSNRTSEEWDRINSQCVATRDYTGQKPPKSAYTPEAQAKKVSKVNYKAIGNKLKKYINQYDLEGNFIQQFHGTSEAASYLGCIPNSIANACRGKTKTLKKYIWKYAG